MNGIVLLVAMTCGIPADQPLSYATARAQADLTKRPLLVLVGADWCPACRVMKHSTLPQMQAAGRLKGVHFAVVNTDNEPQLASRLMQSSSIPQLVLYAPTAEGWFRVRAVGSQSPQQVTAMINRGLELQQQSLARHTTTSRAASPTTGTGGE